MLVLDRSLLNRGYILINDLKALASIASMCSPCNFLIEDYTEIFYAVYKWNIPSIQRKRKIRRPNSMRKVDCSSFLFIDF
jgi:hypothetical protein